MSDPFASLDRSLREGPPDELGYRDRRRELEIGFGASAGGVTPVQRVGPVHGVRRPRPFTSSMQLPVAVLIVTLIGGGFVAFVGRNHATVVGPVASASASPSAAATPSGRPEASTESSAIPTPDLPSSAPVSVPPLTQTFTSPRNGFSIAFPEDWTATPATQSWPPNTFTQLGSPVLDQLALAGAYRLVIASQPLGAGQSEAQWVSSYFAPFNGAMECAKATDLPAAPRMPIDGRSAYLHLAGCPIYADSAMSPNDVMFEAFVFTDDRVYQITLDGEVDLAFFKAMLATMTLDPASAIDPPPS